MCTVANPDVQSSGKVPGKAGMVQTEPIKYRLFQWLRENPSMRKRGYLRKAAAELNIDYHAKKELLWKYASEFKTDIRSLPENGRGSKCRVCSKPDSQHACFAEVFVPECLSRERFVEVTKLAQDVGWRLSKNKNRNLSWDLEQFSVGRVQWWINGRVRVHVVKPERAVEPLGKVKQLLYKAFIASGLIANLEISEAFLKEVIWYSAHDVYDYDRPLPYKKIVTYRELGVETIVTGDVSHRSGLEVHVVKPDIVSKFERLVESLGKAFTKSELDKVGLGKVLEQNSLAIQGFNAYLAEVSKPSREVKKVDRLYE